MTKQTCLIILLIQSVMILALCIWPTQSRAEVDEDYYSTEACQEGGCPGSEADRYLKRLEREYKEKEERQREHDEWLEDARIQMEQMREGL